MTPSQQKLDIDNKRIELQSFVKELESRIEVLKQGMKYIDEGGDVLEDSNMLTNEVHKIMSQRLIDII